MWFWTQWELNISVAAKLDNYNQFVPQGTSVLSGTKQLEVHELLKL